MAFAFDENFGTFYARLMASLGLVVAACGPGGGETAATDGATGSSGGSTGAPTTGGATTGGGSSSGGGSEGGSSGTGEGTSSGASTGQASTGTGEASTGTGQASGSTGEGTSTSTSTGEASSSGGDTGEFTCPPPPPAFMQDYVCFSPPMGLPDCAACDEQCTIDQANTVLTGDPFCFWTEVVIQCGPDPMPEVEGQCCYFVAYGGAMACVGRPFVVDGGARAAAVVRRADWSGAARPALAGLSEGTRAALAELWAADAAMEHASVAAFARFALQLLAVGAPAELVEATQRALADEVAHARACYALAGAYAGCPIGPGPLDMSGALGEAGLTAMVAGAIAEGCVGETLAALVAEAAAERAGDPAVRGVLRQIAEDEGRHAQLAWRFVQWALAQGDAVRAAARAAFEEALAEPVRVAGWPAGVDAGMMRPHGRLAPEEQAALCREALARVIAPAAAALFEQTPVAAAA